LTQITRLQVDFVVEQRSFAKVYYREAPHLPAAELARLQDKQRTYIKEWAGLLHDLRPDLASPSAPDELVHAAIGAAQSALVYKSKSSTLDHHGLLLGAAMRVQGF